MKTIEIKRENVLKAYNKANQPGKELLENLFGKNLVQETFADRIKRFEDRSKCSVTELNDRDVQSIEAYQELIYLTRELNDGWEPNWEDSNERKWYPWFNMKSGFGFSGSACTYSGAYTAVGSRLCFKSEELATYAGKQFESIYKKYLTL